jgi:hypothetical protein
VNALPSGDLIPGPVMVSVGLSVTTLALAEGHDELAVALEHFGRSVGDVRDAFADIRAIGNDWVSAPKALDSTVRRSLLDKLLAAEKMTSDVHEGTARMLSRKEFRHTLYQSGLPDIDAVDVFVGELNATKKLLRGLRLRLICDIADQARTAGLLVFETSDEFRAAFLSASLEETESWQEMAHLLADPENAKRLEEAIRGSGVDEIRTPPGDAPPRS